MAESICVMMWTQDMTLPSSRSSFTQTSKEVSALQSEVQLLENFQHSALGTTVAVCQAALGRL